MFPHIKTCHNILTDTKKIKTAVNLWIQIRLIFLDPNREPIWPPKNTAMASGMIKLQSTTNEFLTSCPVSPETELTSIKTLAEAATVFDRPQPNKYRTGAR